MTMQKFCDLTAKGELHFCRADLFRNYLFLAICKYLLSLPWNTELPSLLDTPSFRSRVLCR